MDAPPLDSFTNAQGLSAHEFGLYGRQLILPQIGVKGQLCLKDSIVVLVGAGGLGSPCALYLSTSGIGTLRIVDGDVVSLTNLHRQIIHRLTKVGQNKAHSAADECFQRNDIINVEAVPDFLDPQNAIRLISGATVVVDASDNARTRYLLNDVCCAVGVPLVSGSVLGWEGQLSVYHYRDGPCYRCLWPTPPPINNGGDCEQRGVLGPAAGTIGVMQATEALKVCLGLSDSVLSGSLLVLDCLSTDRMWRCVRLRSKRIGCMACNRSDETAQGVRELTEMPDEIYPKLDSSDSIEPKVFYHRMLEIVNVSRTSGLLRLKRTEPREQGDSVIYESVVDVRRRPHFETLRIEGVKHFCIEALLDTVKMIDNEDYNSSVRAEVLETLKSSLGLKEFGSVNRFDHQESSDGHHRVYHVYVLCRRGRDASRATKALNRLLTHSRVFCFTVQGGLSQLIRDVPELVNFPFL